MKSQMYVIYDVKSLMYNKPFCFINDNIAIRSCQDLVADQSTEIGRHPEDFTLFHIGEYDDATAEITTHHEFKIVCKMIELKQTISTSEFTEQVRSIKNG